MSPYRNAIIETNRLYMTKFSPGIAREFYELNADEEVLKYTGDQAFSSIKEAIDFLKKYTSYENHGFGRWSVRTKGNNTWIGWCGLRKTNLGHVDLGFRLHKRFWNKGYATEASRACLQYAFETLKLDQVIARSNVNNLASIKVIKKLSLHQWKTELDPEMGEIHYFQISRKMYMSNKF